MKPKKWKKLRTKTSKEELKMRTMNNTLKRRRWSIGQRKRRLTKRKRSLRNLSIIISRI